ncbi:hypothetical protein NDU88_001808 [Pleurodeles waltl]|uniref:Uncharacterized protein n=1 Tax=Pleurodeles waltl TaxID=8319 RepID=A0AAV7VXH4_PLEWA|nr:hypothetical protein NDU88_001808 [Pleurodeles waltl]
MARGMVLFFSGPPLLCQRAMEQSRGERPRAVVARCRVALVTLGAAGEANGQAGLSWCTWAGRGPAGGATPLALEAGRR